MIFMTFEYLYMPCSKKNINPLGMAFIVCFVLCIVFLLSLLASLGEPGPDGWNINILNKYMESAFQWHTWIFESIYGFQQIMLNYNCPITKKESWKLVVLLPKKRVGEEKNSFYFQLLKCKLFKLFNWFFWYWARLCSLSKKSSITNFRVMGENKLLLKEVKNNATYF